MLRAVGVYAEENLQGTIKLKKILSAQQDKNPLFPSNQLENIDDLLLASEFYQTMKPNFFYKFTVNTSEFNYLCKPGEKKYVLVISSKKKLEASEKGFLFQNIEHIYNRPEAVKVTLDEMIMNPLGFTGRDVLVGSIYQGIDQVMMVVQDNIEKVIQRGESLEQLEAKTLMLNDHGREFNKRSIKMHSYCCGYW